MASITSKAAALPKLRVTCLICTEELPQWAQRLSEDIDCDGDEFAGKANFDDGLRRFAVESDTGDDDLAFAGLAVALALRDLPREDDVFEIKDGEVVIFKFLGGMGEYDIIQCADQMPKLADSRSWPSFESIEQPGK